MCQETVSRRGSLKTLGAAGAALVLGGPAAAASQAQPAGGPDRQPTNVVDVATGRFAKGYS